MNISELRHQQNFLLSVRAGQRHFSAKCSVLSRWITESNDLTPCVDGAIICVKLPQTTWCSRISVHEGAPATGRFLLSVIAPTAIVPPSGSNHDGFMLVGFSPAGG
ncbi:hypothetical protein ACSCCP_004868, partial [Escherichia coli]